VIVIPATSAQISSSLNRKNRNGASAAPSRARLMRWYSPHASAHAASDSSASSAGYNGAAKVPEARWSSIAYFAAQSLAAGAKLAPGKSCAHCASAAELRS
jgi:hypothetical protein